MTADILFASMVLGAVIIRQTASMEPMKSTAVNICLVTPLKVFRSFKNKFHLSELTDNELLVNDLWSYFDSSKDKMIGVGNSLVSIKYV